MAQQSTEAVFWIYVLAGLVTLLSTVIVVGVIVAVQRRQIEQARRFSTGLVEAQEAERARIARELHDDIIQRVALIGGEVSGLERAIPGSSEAVTQRIQGLREELQDLAEEIRAMARRAHPSVLEHLGLGQAIQSLATEVGISDDLEVTVRADPAPSLDGLHPSAALSLYRVAQEGLRNVARHAGTREATLDLSRQNGGVQLVVADSGRGVELAGAPHRGLGLLGLGERMRAVQGTLTIDSAPGKGTRLVAWAPIERG